MVFFVLFGCFYQEVVRWTKLARGLEGQSGLDSKRSLTVDFYTLAFTNTNNFLHINDSFYSKQNVKLYWIEVRNNYRTCSLAILRTIGVCKSAIRYLQPRLYSANSRHYYRSMQYPSCLCHYYTINLIEANIISLTDY